MKMTVYEITKMVNGSLDRGDGAYVINGAAGLADAASTDISFLSNKRYCGMLSTTMAGALLVAPGTSLPDGIRSAIIRVDRPDAAFARILAVIAKEKQAVDPGIHPDASVDPTARLGSGVSVGPRAVISAQVQIGDGCTVSAGCFIGNECTVGSNTFLHPNVTLLRDTKVGNRCIIHSGTVTGSDGYGFTTKNGTHHKIPQVGNVHVGDDVEIGANVTVDRGTTGSTRIGSGTKIDNLVHVAHNVIIGTNCLIVAQVGISGSARIGNTVTIAGQAGIAGHITIGDNAVIGGKAGVTCSISAGEVVSGFPARPHREVMKLKGYVQRLPKLFKEIAALRSKDKKT